MSSVLNRNGIAFWMLAGFVSFIGSSILMSVMITGKKNKQLLLIYFHYVLRLTNEIPRLTGRAGSPATRDTNDRRSGKRGSGESPDRQVQSDIGSKRNVA